MKKPAGRTLFLIPWHIGNRADLTLNAVRMARRLRCFITEDAEDTRAQLQNVLHIDCAGKELLTVPIRFDKDFLTRVLNILRKEDAGMISSGGAPCFADPGGWLVRELRERGVSIAALAGASTLSTLLSLSGFDWIQTPASGSFSFIFFRNGVNEKHFREVVGRDREPVAVFLEKPAFRDCLKVMRDLIGKRPVAVFFDLTKVTSSNKYPYANQVRTLSCADWLREAKKIRWEKISDVALLVHPAEAGS